MINSQNTMIFCRFYQCCLRRNDMRKWVLAKKLKKIMSNFVGSLVPTDSVAPLGNLQVLWRPTLSLMHIGKWFTIFQVIPHVAYQRGDLKRCEISFAIGSHNLPQNQVVTSVALVHGTNHWHHHPSWSKELCLAQRRSYAWTPVTPQHGNHTCGDGKTDSASHKSRQPQATVSWKQGWGSV